MEVQFWKEKVIKVNNQIVNKMKEIASINESGKFRYCLHESEQSGIQEMIFVIPQTGYARPHKHEKFAESQVILEGDGYCILFNDKGDIIDYFYISPSENFLYRIQAGIWHMLLPVSEQLVVYEVREGKFEKNTNIFPNWAPEQGNAEIENYKNRILKTIRMRR